MILLLNLEFCNVKSVQQAFGRIGVPVVLGATARDVEAADVVILPGVGAFKQAMTRLGQSDLPRALRAHALDKGKPLIGICLGMQLLADESAEHGRHPGLGIIPGKVEKLPARMPDDRVPNMGWSGLEFRGDRACHLQRFDGEACYFAHSYHFLAARDADIVATIKHGGKKVAAIIRRGAVIGMQFHPEKSLDTGLEILQTVMEDVALSSGLERRG
jgi:glutamine amidotransferase